MKLFLYLRNAARGLCVQKWEDTMLPTMEEWLVITEHAEMAKLTV